MPPADQVKSEHASRSAGRLGSRVLVALAEIGIDVSAVLAHVDLAVARESELVWPAYDVWQAAVERSGESGIGVRVGERVVPGDFGLLGGLVSSSGTLGEAFLHGLRMSRLSISAARLSLYADGEHACVALEPQGLHKLHSEEVDFIMASAVLAARALTKRDFIPIEVSFVHDAPRDTRHHRRVFRAPVRFGAAQTTCTFPTALLLSPLPTSDSSLISTLTEKADEKLARCPTDLHQQVRAAILAELRVGEPSVSRVSFRLGTSPRMLVRKLSALGLSYRELLADTRFELAERLLRRPRERMSTIAEALGYSEKSAFLRAFKRRAGCSPLEYRQRVVGELAQK